MQIRIDHNTDYAFNGPVQLGRHRLMLRPRDSFDLRDPAHQPDHRPPAVLSWTHDVYGNSICWAEFGSDMVESLSIHSALIIERYKPATASPAAMAWTPGARVAYGAEEGVVLAPYMQPSDSLGDDALEAFALDAVTDPIADAPGKNGPPHPLTALANRIHAALTYNMRFEEGTQAPAHTLSAGTGTCRDYAWLFIECARRLGYAARFVTGYLHAAPDGYGQASSGYSHAWADVFIPGDGWVEFDPTNLLVADRQLIRVAVTRTPAEASPVSGSFTGLPQTAPPTVSVAIQPLVAAA